MSFTRPDLGFGDELDSFDPTKWSPPPKRATTPPQKAETRQLAEATGFKSREPQAPAPAAPIKGDRRRRTGRNAQFNVKARPETIEAFCQVADEQGWGLGETFEKAVALLKGQYSETVR